MKHRSKGVILRCLVSRTEQRTRSESKVTQQLAIRANPVVIPETAMKCPAWLSACAAMFNNLISGSERDRVSHIWVRKRQGEFVTHRGGPLRLVGCPPVWFIGGSVGKSSAEYSRSEIGSFVSAVIHRGVGGKTFGKTV